LRKGSCSKVLIFAKKAINSQIICNLFKAKGKALNDQQITGLFVHKMAKH
jgi:hypothetical protein